MPSTFALFCATLLATALATEVPPVGWDKYADEHVEPYQPAQDPNEPTSVDAAWEEAHGGAAPVYDAFDFPGAFDKLASAATSVLSPSASLTLNARNNDIPLDPEEEAAWARAQGYDPINKRSLSSPSTDPTATPHSISDDLPIPVFPPVNSDPTEQDIETDAWALAQGYRPLRARSDPNEPSTDPDSESFALDNGYRPLNARSDPNDPSTDPDSEAFALANGYLHPGLAARDTSTTDIESEAWARENGYAPLNQSKRGVVRRASGLMNWVLSLGRRPGAVGVHARGEEDVESEEWAIKNGYVPLGKRGEEKQVDVESEEWARANGYAALQ